MEGEIMTTRFAGPLVILSILCGALTHAPFAYAQGAAPVGPSGAQPEISLRKSPNVREFHGRPVEGEDRVIGRGDSLWRILVQEKGLPVQKFHGYLVVIRGLNPRIKNLEVLRIGDRLFIPLQPEEAAEVGPRADQVAASERAPPGAGAVINYRVKSGDQLYQILRDQLKISDQRQQQLYYALVKDLNPERKNWNILMEGEIIRLPTTGAGQEAVAAGSQSGAVPRAIVETVPTAETKPVQETKLLPTALDSRQVLRAPAKENLAVIAQVVEALGSQMQRAGEEVVALKDGAVRIDRSSYPVAYNPKLSQRVVIDPEDKFPATLRAKLSDASVGIPVLAMAKGTSLQEAVGQLLSALGYQALPADRPVIIQDQGVAFEAKGSWMVLAPQENNRAQDVFVINLTDNASEIPEHLKTQLASKGLHLKDVLLPSSAQQAAAVLSNEAKNVMAPVNKWPRDRRDMVDAFLLSLAIPFGVAETLTADLGNGVRVETKTDRVFDLNGQRTALSFQRADPDIKKALQEKQGIRVVELELASLSSRELIAKLVNLVGDQADYREHRFPAANGSAPDRLTVTAWGFHLTKRSMFVTDREIPPALHRFFFEKGLEIVYFQ
jgi:hypothetical protein